MSKNLIKNEIEGILSTMAEAFAEKDLDKYLNLYEDHPELVIYGSQEGEKWTSLSDFRESVIKNWLMIDSVEVVYSWKRIDSNPEGTIAWFASELSFVTKINEQEMNIQGRLTGVLVKKKGTWKFVQTHYSMEHK
jgi:ketosteroid isomerase-like protein